ncbi:hypothetical protein ER308_00155 [Egibacter rhizosphaerae]|uniref:Septum formation initiator family protein n=1 Tax=Egibacter rhizosphaerae TaxID=1670831 RepID=A0A411YAC5_9ACTN|nr:hypothetical protein [Egibacter rhizosphaerae]QBI18138.1 hypothetical protein ER308_00155 [Egibacter rhizosphaerae]
MAALPSPRPSAPLPGHDADGLQPDQRPRPEARPSLRVLERRRARGRGLTALAALALFGVFAIVGLHAMAAQASFEAQALEQEVAALSDEVDERSARVAALESPERLRTIAEEELGLVPAADQRYVELDPRLDSLPERGVVDTSDPDPQDG